MSKILNLSVAFSLAIITSFAFYNCTGSLSSSSRNVIQNNEIGVPSGNQSLYKSVILGALLPMIDDENKYKERIKLLTGMTDISLDRKELARNVENIEFLKSNNEFKKLFDTFIQKYQIDINENINKYSIQDLSNKLNIQIEEYTKDNNKTSSKIYKPQSSEKNSEKSKSPPTVIIIKDNPDTKELPHNTSSNTKFMTPSLHYRAAKPTSYVDFLRKISLSNNKSNESNLNEYEQKTYSDEEKHDVNIDTPLVEDNSFKNRSFNKNKTELKYKKIVNKIYLSSQSKDDQQSNDEKNDEKGTDSVIENMNLDNFDSKDQKELAFCMNRVFDMKDCFMKDIKNCYYKVKLKVQCEKNERKPEIQLNKSTKIIFNPEEVKKTLDDLAKRLEEHPNGYRIKTLLKETTNFVNTSDWKEVVDKLAAIKRKLEPLDVELLYYYVYKALKATHILKDTDDIVLFFGRTGAGKSTTIQFLAGSKMSKCIDSASKLPHITYQNDSNNKYLKNITCSPEKKSETRYVNIVPISLKKRDINIQDKDTVILCDSPGLDDTNGPEVDISNSIGISHTLTSVNSVKPVILIPKEETDGRGILFKKLANSIVQLIPSFDKFKKSFSYLISRAENFDIKKDFEPVFNNLIQVMEPEDKNNTGYVSFLNDIHSESKKKKYPRLRIINPVEDDANEMLEDICDNEFIMNPSENFKCTISVESKDAIKSQLDLFDDFITKALNKEQYSIASMYLKLWSYLINILPNQEYIKSKFEQAMERVDNLKSIQVENAKKSIELLSQSNSINENNLIDLKNTIKKLDQGKDIGQKYSDNESPSFTVIKKIQNMIIKLLVSIESKELLDKSIWDDVKKINIITKCFDEFSNVKNTMESIINKKVERLRIWANNNIKNENFANLIDHMVLINKNYMEFYENDKFKIKQMYIDLQNKLQSKVLSLTKEIDDIIPIIDINKQDQNNNVEFNIIPLSDDDIIIVKKNFKKLKEYHDKLKPYEKTEPKISKFVEIYDKKFNRIIEYIKSNCHFIQNSSNSFKNRSFKRTTLYLKNIQKLRNIPDISAKTNFIYFRLEQSFKTNQENLEEEVLKIINSVDINKPFNEELFFDKLMKIKRSESLSEQGTDQEIWNHISKHLNTHLNNIIEQIDDYDLSTEKHSNLEIFRNICSHTRKMENIKEYMPKFEEKIIKIYIKIYIKLDRIFKNILNECDTSQISNEKKDHYLDILNQIQEAYEKEKQIKNKLKKTKVRTIQQLENKTKDYENKLNKKKEKINKFNNEFYSSKVILNIRAQISTIEKLKLEAERISIKQKPKSRLGKVFSKDAGLEYLKKNGYKSFDNLKEKLRGLYDKEDKLVVEFNKKTQSLVNEVNLKDTKLKEYKDILKECKYHKKYAKKIQEDTEKELKEKHKNLKQEDIDEIYNREIYRQREITKYTKLKNSRLSNSRYTFGDVDLKRYDDMLTFLKKSEKIINKIPDLNNKPKITEIKDKAKNTINDYIKKYCDFLQNDIDNCLSYIKETHNNNTNGYIMKVDVISKLDTLLNQLCNSLSKIKEANNKDKYSKELANFFKLNRMDRALKEITNLSTELEEIMIPLTNNRNSNLAILKNYVHFARSMRVIDEWIDSQKSFSKIFLTSQKTLSSHDKLDMDTVFKNLKTMNFQRIYTDILSIQELSKIDDQAKQILPEIKDQLFYFLNSKLREVQQKIITLGGSNVELNSIIILEEELTKIAQAKRLFFESKNEKIFNSDDRSQLAKKESYNKQLLNGWVKNIIETIKNYINLMEFKEAEDLLDKVNRFLSLLNNEHFDIGGKNTRKNEVKKNNSTKNHKHTDDTFKKDKITDNDDEKNEESSSFNIGQCVLMMRKEINDKLKQEVKKYSEITIQNKPFFRNPYTNVGPKILYENLKKVFHKNSIYSQTWKKIENDIKEKMFNLIEQLSPESSNTIDISRAKNIIRICSDIFSSLPEHMQIPLSNSLKSTNDLFTENKKNWFKKIDKTMSSGSIRDKKKCFKEAKKMGDKRSMDKIKDNLILEAKEINNNINNHIHNNQFDKALYQLTKLQEYKNNYNELDEEFKHIYDQSDKQINNEVDKLLQRIQNSPTNLSELSKQSIYDSFIKDMDALEQLENSKYLQE